MVLTQQPFLAHSPPLCQAWIEEMSAYLRELDPNHLISIGSEGFFG